MGTKEFSPPLSGLSKGFTVKQWLAWWDALRSISEQRYASKRLYLCLYLQTFPSRRILSHMISTELKYISRAHIITKRSICNIFQIWAVAENILNKLCLFPAICLSSMLLDFRRIKNNPWEWDKSAKYVKMVKKSSIC